MIKTETQLRNTKAHLSSFQESLRTLEAQSHSLNETDEELLLNRRALKGMIEDLIFQIQEYEELKNPRVKRVSLRRLEDLPLELIKARISTGLTQKNLAEKLGLREQQVQRYEANNYSGVSWERLLEIAAVLGIEIENSQSTSSADGHALEAKLNEIGFKKQFIFEKFLPPSIRATTSPSTFLMNDTIAKQYVLSALARVYGLSLSMLQQSNLPRLKRHSVRYKLPKNGKVSEPLVGFVEYLVRTVLSCSPVVKKKAPQLPEQFRDEVEKHYSVINFKTCLEFVWDLGIPVIPLRDSGGFHAACWRLHDRHVIILKQDNPSHSRWEFDLLHEYCHTLQLPNIADFALFEAVPEAENVEVEANNFSSVVLLGKNSENYLEECVKLAGGKVESLKRVVPIVARRNKISAAHLANSLAYRLSLQRINWWGAASSFQEQNEHPMSVALSVFRSRIDLSSLPDIDRSLLNNAILNEE